jgi:23S rRNA (cytidine1920-2'-O)/16S rRNA (cytidine1409-2'-O)-methyltransferase
MVMNFANTLGFLLLHLDYSPIRGPEGNIEYLLHMRKSQSEDISALLQSVPEIVSRAHQSL